MAKIAVLGLGQMGTPMAIRLLGAGHNLTVWNRTAERTAPLVERGAASASSPAEAAAGAEVVITMLATPEALEQVVLGPGGLAEALDHGQLLVDMSTVGPDAVRRVAEGLPAGVGLVDAPVRGSVREAAEGRLEVLVGATDADFARVRPVLEPLGVVRHVGGPGSGAAVKLVANLALGAAIASFGECLALGDGLGLERAIVLDVLADSPIGSTARSKRENVESGRFPPRFKLRLAGKDLRLATEAAAGAGRELEVGDAALRWFERAEAEGRADLDYAAVVATITGQDASA